MSTARASRHPSGTGARSRRARGRADLALLALVAGVSVGVAHAPARAAGATTSVSAQITEVLTAPLAYTTDGAHVFVLDTAARQVLTSIPVPGAGAFAVTADSRTVYVSSADGISVIDATTNTVSGDLPLPAPVGEIALSADGSRLYAVTGTALLTIDPATGAVLSTIPVTGSDLAVPLPMRAYVADFQVVKIVDLTSGVVVSTLAAAERHAVYDLTSSPDGQRVYILQSQERFVDDQVDVVDTMTGTVVETLAVAPFTNELAVSPDGGRLIVTSQLSVAFHDTSTGATVGSASIGLGSYYQAAFTPDGSSAFVTKGSTKEVAVVDTSSFDASRIKLRTAAAPIVGIAGALAALPDSFAPGCDVEVIKAGTNGGLFTVFDTGAGLRSIDTTGSTNVHVEPSFTRGTTEPVVFTAFQVDGTQPAQVRLLLTDELGQSSPCALDLAAVPGATTTTTVAPTTTTTTVPVPAGNALDPDTSTLEGSAGQWVPWFSANPSRSGAQAHGGTHSLLVDVTGPHGWGVQLGNYPGFSATPGNKELGFWARAGTGDGLDATMTVSWRDESAAVLRTDTVALSNLGAAWQPASAVVTAPPGAHSVDVTLTGSKGGVGTSLYLDDLVVADTDQSPPPPPPDADNALDADTSTLEGTIGEWTPWFSADVSRSAAAAHSGTDGLQVDVTAPFGWGVQLANYPGFAATSGSKVVSFWGRSPNVGPAAGRDAGLGATMRLSWRDATDAVIGTDTVTLILADAWQQAARTVTAPPGTATLDVTFSDPGGLPGDTVYLDDVRVGQAANVLDADTAGAEGSVGAWGGWFSAKPSRSTAHAHSGASSLRVDVTEPYGWGIQLDHYPGFATGAGPKLVSFWVLAGSGVEGSGAAMTVYWRDASGAVLGTDQVGLPAGSPGWQQATALVTAPPGAKAVDVTVSDASGGPGDVLFIDDVAIADR